jgi:hypothetical protein
MRRAGVKHVSSNLSSITGSSSTDSLELTAFISTPQLKDAIKRVRSSSLRSSSSWLGGRDELLTVDEIPEYLKENPFILSGYRQVH